MRVSITIESEGVVTEVSREYEPEIGTVRTLSGETAVDLEDPPLRSVTSAVAEAATITHRLTT